MSSTEYSIVISYDHHAAHWSSNAVTLHDGNRLQHLPKNVTYTRRLEKEMAIPSSILAGRTPQTEEPGRLQSLGLQELDMTWRLKRARDRGDGCVT